MNIYLICYEGVEWCDPVKAYTKEKDAHNECERMNADPKAKDGMAFPELSRFTVKDDVPLYDTAIQEKQS